MLGEVYIYIYISSQLIRYIVVAVNPIHKPQTAVLNGGRYRGWSLQEVADRHPKRFAFRQCETDSGAVLMWSIWCGRWCINYQILCMYIYMHVYVHMYIYMYMCIYIYIRIIISNDEIDHHWWSIGAYVFIPRRKPWPLFWLYFKSLDLCPSSEECPKMGIQIKSADIGMGM